MKSRKNKGFTLIELLAVILILGVIALIAIPTISSVITDSKKELLNLQYKILFPLLKLNVRRSK